MGRDKTNNNNNRQTKKEKMAEKKAKKAEQFDVTHGKNKVQRNAAGNGNKKDNTGTGAEGVKAQD
uniref:Uncharacterized protein n=1 Tax=Kwoniella bestiolae CBS 10118 TaxID=1296100 RepID=A0A1B9GCF2_9TREE|nr:hypothetical protein I302_00184 [Kwoniella bestiolae CBS 10118]OCF28695.1 hypothetical protein I302_00184 [Kwoniella bestiolae CBS 10118]